MPGAHIATLVGDPTIPEIVVQRFKFPPNHRVAPPIHTYTEMPTVLNGTLGLGEGEKFDTGKGVILKVGSEFALKAGQQHLVWTASKETAVQVVPGHDPRKK
jgi:hypothetical protein